MSCSFDREIIQKYADNTIDSLELVFLREHINYCNECRQELDLVMTLENELGKFFDDDIEAKELDSLIAGLVDDCMYELSRSERVKQLVSSSIKIVNEVVDNSVRFIEYIPGSRHVGKGVKKSTSAARGLLKSLVKKEVGKLKKIDYSNIIFWG